MFGGANWNDCPILSDISFNAFTNESKIEIHECNTAIGGDEYYFSVLIYLNLFELGKTKSVVIGHTINTSPLLMVRLQKLMNNLKCGLNEQFIRMESFNF